jgi:hypothetical protein
MLDYVRFHHVLFVGPPHPFAFVPSCTYEDKRSIVAGLPPLVFANLASLGRILTQHSGCTPFPLKRKRVCACLPSTSSACLAPPPGSPAASRSRYLRLAASHTPLISYPLYYSPYFCLNSAIPDVLKSRRCWRLQQTLIHSPSSDMLSYGPQIIMPPTFTYSTSFLI